MSKRNLVLTLFFVVISVAILLLEFLDLSPNLFSYLLKPMIMLWIGLYFLINRQKKSFTTGVLLAFFFSLCGDVLLMLPRDGGKEIFFYAGVGGFFLAQIMYIIIFLANSENFIKGFLLRNPLWFIPFIAYGIGIYLLLFPKLDGIMVPIILIYAISLIGMSLAAVNRRDRVGSSSFRLVVAGSLFFLASDSMLAVNKFHSEIAHAGFFIMSSYILAQYLIMRGLILEKE